MRPRILLLTPPLVQTNTPYPATMHLTGFLRERGYNVFQRDLSVKVVRDVLLAYGGDEADQLLELLQSDLPPEDKLEASAVIDELALGLHMPGWRRQPPDQGHFWPASSLPFHRFSVSFPASKRLLTTWFKPLIPKMSSFSYDCAWFCRFLENPLGCRFPATSGFIW